MKNQQQVSKVQQLQNSFNILIQGIEKANQKGVFQLKESSILFNSIMLLKNYIESTLQPAPAQPAPAQPAPAQLAPAQPTTTQPTENVKMEISK
tara:strand:+ start:187 stop:468 length:282 start_codon:yes stop_codon:yes gene_type:complete